MKKMERKILFMVIFLMSLGFSRVNASWEIEQIESIYDDGFIAETGGAFFETSWVQIKGGSVNIASYFAFRGVTIPANSKILNAYLEFTAPFPWNYNQTLTATVYGLKLPDLTSWNPTPSLLSEPLTTAFTNFDVAPLISGASFNVSVTDQVKEIYDLYGWTTNNDMGFSVLTVAVSGGERYQVAFDSNQNKSVSLYIEFSEADDTTTYYKGYKIVQSLVNAFGLADPWKWVDKPITLVTSPGGVERMNVTAWNLTGLYHAQYGQPFDYVEPYQEGLFYDVVWGSSILTNEVRSPLDVGWGQYNSSSGNYGTAVTFYMTGELGGTDPYDGNLALLNVVGQVWSGTWSTRQSNNRKCVGLSVDAVNSSHISLTPVATNLVVSAVDSTIGSLEIGNYFLISTTLDAFSDFWMGSQYQYAYSNNLFGFDANTGSITNMGRMNLYFNISDISIMDCINLFVDYGYGTSGEWISHQMLRGWNPEKSYPDWTVYDENGTEVYGADSLDEAKEWIDGEEGVTPDDPNPPGTNYPDDGKGQLTRFNMRFYVWMIGWVLIFIPPLAMAYKAYPFKFYLVFFIVEITGWALLWSIASI